MDKSSDFRAKALSVIVKSIDKIRVSSPYRQFMNLALDEVAAKVTISAVYEIGLIDEDEKLQFEDSLEKAVFEFQKGHI